MNTTYGLRPDQMAGLFSVGSDEPNPEDQESNTVRMARRLQQHMTCTLPQGSLVCEALLMIMERLGGDLSSAKGQSLGQLLLAGPSDIELIKTIKESSKALLCDLDSRTDAALANVTYHAALASALVHHDEMISQYSFEKLSRSFAQLIGKRWMTKELVDLFTQARGICESRCKPA